jgi:hypothetical protein
MTEAKARCEGNPSSYKNGGPKMIAAGPNINLHLSKTFICPLAFIRPFR